eukprot:gene17422-biopygen6796
MEVPIPIFPGALRAPGCGGEAARSGKVCRGEWLAGASTALLCIRARIDLTRGRPHPGEKVKRGEPGQAARLSARSARPSAARRLAEANRVRFFPPRMPSGLGEVLTSGRSGGELRIREWLDGTALYKNPVYRHHPTPPSPRQRGIAPSPEHVQSVPDAGELRQKRQQGKGGGEPPTSPASPTSPTLAHLASPLNALSAAQQRSLAILQRSFGDSSQRADTVGRGGELPAFADSPAGETFGERRRPEERVEGSGEVRKNQEGKKGKEEEEQEDRKDVDDVEERNQLVRQINETKKVLGVLQSSSSGKTNSGKQNPPAMVRAIAAQEARLQSLRAQLACLEQRPNPMPKEV